MVLQVFVIIPPDIFRNQKVWITLVHHYTQALWCWLHLFGPAAPTLGMPRTCVSRSSEIIPVPFSSMARKIPSNLSPRNGLNKGRMLHRLMGVISGAWGSMNTLNTSTSVPRFFKQRGSKGWKWKLFGFYMNHLQLTWVVFPSQWPIAFTLFVGGSVCIDLPARPTKPIRMKNSPVQEYFWIHGSKSRLHHFHHCWNSLPTWTPAFFRQKTVVHLALPK